MHRLKSIKLYFFSILKLFFLSFRNYYFRSNFYNKNLVTFIPHRIFYSPSSYLCASLTTISSDFYKITNTSPELLWKTSVKDKIKFNNLHSFLWLTKLDRKNSKIITKNIISSWINNFFDYDITGLIIILIMILIHGKWKLSQKELLHGPQTLTLP